MHHALNFVLHILGMLTHQFENYITCIHTLPYTGYDKVKPYGFPVNGGIDMFSRKILCLEVARSNNDPQMAATFYLK